VRLLCGAEFAADDLYSTLVDINKDENIPINRQANKQSKGDHAAIAQDKAKEQIKGMIQGTGWVSGKWCVFLCLFLGCCARSDKIGMHS
jgi:hypothetical protein